MTDHNERLSAAELRMLDFSLGADNGLAGDLEATALRDLVLKARVEAVSEPVSQERIDQLVSAARELNGVPSMWSLFEGRLRRSPLMRLVAASLLVHLCALPVLAWMHFAGPLRHDLWIRFEQPEPAITSEPEPEMLEPVDVHDLLEGLDPSLLEEPDELSTD